MKRTSFRPQAIELHLGKSLRTGEGIKISYRLDLEDSFTEVKTLDYATNKVGAISSRIFPINVSDRIKQGDQLQIRVALKGTATTTPSLKYLIIV